LIALRTLAATGKWGGKLLLGVTMLVSQAIAAGGDLKHPDWHPGGKLLIAEGSCFGGGDLFLIDLDGDAVTMAWDGGHNEGYPRWFSDGERVAFHQIDDERNARIFVAKLGKNGKVDRARRMTNGPFDIEPAPSPAGQTLAFSRTGTAGQDIALLDIATRKLTRTWQTGAAENFPSWHPDGSAVLFHARDDAGTQVYQRDRRTGEVTQLTEGMGPNLVADMSSDGRALVFSSERSGDREIYLRDMVSGAERRLTERVGRDGYPKFSPDNRQIAYHSKIDEEYTVVRVLDLDSDRIIEFGCPSARDIGRDS